MTIILVASTGLLCFCIGYGMGWSRATDLWISTIHKNAEAKYSDYFKKKYNALH